MSLCLQFFGFAAQPNTFSHILYLHLELFCILWAAHISCAAKFSPPRSGTNIFAMNAMCIIPDKITVLDLYKVSIFRYIIYSVPWPLFPKVSIFQLQVLKDATVLPVTAHQVQLQWQMLIFEKMDFEQDLLKRKSVK